jgi:hypothetical protein
MYWRTSDLDSTRTIRTHFSPDTSDTLRYAPDSPFRYLKERRLLFDIGFYQDNILEGLDFGLVFHDLMAYAWRQDKPTVRHVDSTYDDTAFMGDSIPDSTIDSTYYVNRWNDRNGKNGRIYKRLTVGFAYHAPLMQNKVMMIIPFDLEFIGLFDKKIDMKLGLHTGIEGWFNDKLCLRFGYAFAPHYISGKPGTITLNNDHLFSGGASVRFDKVQFDIYILKQDWGIGSTIMF